MCTIWTPEQWLENSQRNSGYTLMDTRYNQTGDTARTYNDTYGRVYAVVSNEDQPRFSPAYYDDTHAAALAYLAENGYTLTEQPVVETSATPDIIVQGRTLAQWAEEGRLNEARDEHVHPTPPTREEFESMDAEERDNLLAAKHASNTKSEEDYMEALFGLKILAELLGDTNPVASF